MFRSRQGSLVPGTRAPRTPGAAFPSWVWLGLLLTCVLLLGYFSLDSSGAEDAPALAARASQLADFSRRTDIHGLTLCTADTQVLFLSDCGLQQLPPALAQCSAMRVLSLRHNQLTQLGLVTLPAASTSALEQLILTDNHLASLPSNLSQWR